MHVVHIDVYAPDRDLDHESRLEGANIELIITL